MAVRITAYVLVFVVIYFLQAFPTTVSYTRVDGEIYALWYDGHGPMPGMYDVYKLGWTGFRKVAQESEETIDEN